MAVINLFRRWVPALIYDQFSHTFRFFFLIKCRFLVIILTSFTVCYLRDFPVL